MSLAIKYDYLPHNTITDWERWEGKWELINGIPYSMSPMPNRKHQRINTLIATQLENKISCEDCFVYIPIDWQIDDETVLEPDVSVICGEWEGHYLTYPPEIIFEILSPSTALKDRNLKFQIYQLQKVKYYIIVDPNAESAEVYQIEEGVYGNKGVFKDGEFMFEWNDCKLNFDFSKIWY